MEIEIRHRRGTESRPRLPLLFALLATTLAAQPVHAQALPPERLEVSADSQAYASALGSLRQERPQTGGSTYAAVIHGSALTALRGRTNDSEAGAARLHLLDPELHAMPEPLSRVAASRTGPRTILLGVGVGVAVGTTAFLIQSGGCWRRAESMCELGIPLYVGGGAVVGGLIGYLIGKRGP